MKKLLSVLMMASALAACVPAIMIAGGASGVMSLHDRRTTGVQADDEGIEWKALQRVPQKYAEVSHTNYTSYNARVLITGEAPNESVRQGIGDTVLGIAGVREIFNEMVIAENSSLVSRSNDSYITSKIKAKLVEVEGLSANHIKVVTEAGIVYLMGIVTANEASLAIETTRVISGVRKVVSLFEVLPDAQIKAIDDSLKGEKNTSTTNILQHEYD